MKDTNVRYIGIEEVIESLNRISNDNIEIGNTFKTTIENFKNNKSLSSKVITPSMESMIGKINKINLDVKEQSDRYAEFLSNEVKVGYGDTDKEISNLWIDLEEIYNKAKEQ